MKITRHKIKNSAASTINSASYCSEDGFIKWMQQHKGISKEDVSPEKWEELGTKFYPVYRRECEKKLDRVESGSEIEFMTKIISPKEDYFYDHASSLTEEEVQMFKDLGFLRNDGHVFIPKGTPLKYVGNEGSWLLYQVEGTDYIISFNNTDKVFENYFDEDFCVVQSSKTIESSTGISKRDLQTLAKAALDATTVEDLNKVISGLLPHNREKWAKYSEMLRDGEYSVAAIGKMISDDLYWEMKDSSNDLIESSTTICSAYECMDDSIGDKGQCLDEDELKIIYDDLHDYDPSVGEYSSFESWLRDTVENGYLREVSEEEYADGWDEYSEDVYEDTEAIFYPELNHRLTRSELKQIYEDLRDMGDPVVLDYDTFEDWLQETIESGYLRKVTACDSVLGDQTSGHDDEDLEVLDQEFTSRDTSINSSKLPAIYKLVSFPKGSTIIDYGGGKFDNAMDYLASIGCEGRVYDPYNRDGAYNRETVRFCRQNGGADIGLCSNVLNVIKEPEVRKNVLQNLSKLVKSGGDIYITVYEGKGSGEGKQSQKDSYQLNRKTSDYLEEIQEVFPNAARSGKLIHATNTGAITSSEDATSSAEGLETVKDMFEDGYTGSGWFENEIKLDPGDGTRLKQYLEDLGYRVKKNIQKRLWVLPGECFWSDTIFYPYRPDPQLQTVASSETLEGAINEWPAPYQVKEVCKEIADQLYDVAVEVMTGPEFGFDLKDISDYLVIQVDPIYDEYSSSGDVVGYVAEVRAEMSYEGMDELARELNPVVQKQDPDAYFDHVTGGIIDAYMYFPRYKQSLLDTVYTSQDSLQDRVSEYLDSLGGCDSYEAMIKEISDRFGISPDTAVEYLDRYSRSCKFSEWHDTADQEDADELDYEDTASEHEYMSDSELLDYIVDHYEEITGEPIRSIYLLEEDGTVFNQDAVDRTYGKIVSFLSSHGKSNKEIDELVYELDDRLTSYLLNHPEIIQSSSEINLPAYAVKYVSGYAGNGVNRWEYKYFRTVRERDEFIKELESNPYSIEYEVFTAPNFYHTSEDVESSIKTRHPNYCPHCTNMTLVEVEDGLYVCEECGAEYHGYPSFEGGLDLTSIEESESIEAGKLIDTPQEVIDELIEILRKYGFELDKRFTENPGKTLIMEDVHLQVINPKSHVDSDENVSAQLRKYVTDSMIDEIDALADRSNCPITWNFNVDDNLHVTGGLDIMKKYVDDSKDSDESLRKEIYDYLDDIGGYADYNQKIEDVAEDFELSLEEAEGYVCDWIQDPTRGREDINSSYGAATDWTRRYNSELSREEYSLHAENGSAFIYGFDHDGRWGYHATVDLKNGRHFSKSFHLKDSLEKAKEYCETRLNISKDEVEAASYGGVYDIEDDQFFTKDELVEFGDSICDEFNLWSNQDEDVWYLESVYITPSNKNLLELSITDGDITLDAKVNVDMRKIRSPKDIEKYRYDLMRQLQIAYKEYFDVDSTFDVHASKDSVNSAEIVIDWDEPIDTKKTFRFDFDRKVKVDENTVDFADDEVFEPLYDEDFQMSINTDGNSFAEDLLELISVNIPEDPGEYRVSGTAVMTYEVSDVYESYEEDDLTGYKTDTYYTDEAVVEFDKNSSWVENLIVEAI